jgi:hypothetical protein
MIIVVTSSVFHSHHSHENVATKKKERQERGEKIGEIWRGRGRTIVTI